MFVCLGFGHLIYLFIFFLAKLKRSAYGVSIL